MGFNTKPALHRGPTSSWSGVSPNIARQMDEDADGSRLFLNGFSPVAEPYWSSEFSTRPDFMGKHASPTHADVFSSLHSYIQQTADVTATRRYQTTPSVVAEPVRCLIKYPPTDVQHRTTHHLCIDASVEGWGAHLNDQETSGLWSSEEIRSHIGVLEIKAVINAVHHWT